MGTYFLGYRPGFADAVKEVVGMSLLAKLRSFLRNLFFSHHVDADLEYEVHSRTNRGNFF
jgi:hypothetical protein